MCADQKIRRYARTHATSGAVGFPGGASLKSGRCGSGLNSNQRVERQRGPWRQKGTSRDFGRYHLASHQTAFRQGRAEGGARPWAKHGIGSEHVEQDVAVHGGYHSGFSLPRRSSMISSVERPRFRMPYNSSIASRELRFLDMISRPRSSLTSKTWPVPMPKRTRKGLGMVICPFWKLLFSYQHCTNSYFERKPRRKNEINRNSKCENRKRKPRRSGRVSSFEFRVSVFNDPMTQWPDDPIKG